jgi:hypothetical protein
MNHRAKWLAIWPALRYTKGQIHRVYALKASIPYCDIFWGFHHAAFNCLTRSRVPFFGFPS